MALVFAPEGDMPTALGATSGSSLKLEKAISIRFELILGWGSGRKCALGPCTPALAWAITTVVEAEVAAGLIAAVVVIDGALLAEVAGTVAAVDRAVTDDAVAMGIGADIMFIGGTEAV